MSYIESQNLNYIIATRMYPNQKNEVYGLDDWISICPGIEVNQMYFEHEKGTKRRYIVVRKEVEKQPKAAGKLLFEDLPGYRYSCYVTNLDLPLDAESFFLIYLECHTELSSRIKLILSLLLLESVNKSK